MENRQVDVRHDEADEQHPESYAQVAGPVHVYLGRRTQECDAGYEARYEAQAHGEGLHVPATDQVLVLAPDLLKEEAEVYAYAAAGQEHRHEDRVVGRAEVLQRAHDVLDARQVALRGLGTRLPGRHFSCYSGWK